VDERAGLRVPLGDQSRPWRTQQSDRTVLAIVHNVTSASRLADVLPALDSDPRIQTVFTAIGSSPFTHGVEALFSDLEVIEVPWAEATSRRFDLAVATSHGGNLSALNAPLVLFPHGLGYNKYLHPGTSRDIQGHPGTSRDAGVFGLSEPWLSHNGALIADALVLSHEEQLGRLRRYFPPAAERAVVVGDPCLDRMAASAHLREVYRRSLGVDSDRKLLLISSTWASASLYGSCPDLPERLAAELPLDEYALAVALHPNIWHAHSPWQVRRWLDGAVRAGVLVVPPLETWRAAVLGADLVLGDHGSVTFYAASVGKPVLIAADDPARVDPTSPIARFTAAAPRLHPTLPLRPQVDAALRDPQRSRYAEILTEATSAPGRSAALVRGLLYRMLELPEPARPARTSVVPIPADVKPARVTAIVTMTSVRVRDAEAVVRLQRYPADLRLDDPPDGDPHLLVEWDHHDPALLEIADALLADARTTGDLPLEWFDRALARFPGAALAAAPGPEGTCLIGTRDGRVLAVHPDRTTEPTLLAGAMLALLGVETSLVGGLPARITVVAGRVTRHASLSELAPRPTPPAPG
jgi:hypothetical protein